MLQTKSFAISDSAGVNELLNNYPLAQGMHILVSEGQILVPYNDGRPTPKAFEIITLQEEQQKMRDQIAIVVHSNKVLDFLMADSKDRLNAAKAAWENNRSNKELEKKYKEAEQAHDQLANQHLMNEHEVVRMQINIEKFEETIVALRAE